nr:Uncharacterised protein [Raoultella sp. NCTC 9187]
MLSEVAQLNSFCQPHFALQRLQLAGQELDERRFTGAVASQQADA